MLINEIENKIFEIVENNDVEIDDDEILFNYKFNECIFYISSLHKNYLIENDIVELFNEKIDNTIKKIVDDLRNELNNKIDVKLNNDEFIIKFDNEYIEINDEIENELYNNMKIYF